MLPLIGGCAPKKEISISSSNNFGSGPLVASLPDSERIGLLRWIASLRGTDASAYRVAPPTNDEFSGEDEPLAWEADGWEEFH
jgi:hypothetical protein